MPELAIYADLRVIDSRDFEICSGCDGQCCQGNPGTAWPEDFGAPTLEFEGRVTAALKSGKWAIDRWDNFSPDGEEDAEGEAPGWFLRPAAKNARGVKDFSWGGECVNFKSGVGCSLEHDAKPIGCRVLRPQADHLCRYPSGTITGNGKYDAARAWHPHIAMLQRVYESISKENV